MTTRELLKDLRDRGVTITANAGKLRINAPSGFLNNEIKGELTARKTEILTLLAEAKQATEVDQAPIPVVSRNENIPLTFAQQRLWFIDQIEPGNVSYNIPQVLMLEGVLDMGALGRAIAEIIRRHEILHTLFLVEDGQPFQKPVESGEFDIPVTDLSDKDAEDSWNEAEILYLEESKQPFALDRLPLFRIHLICLAKEQHLLFLNFHHSIADAGSISIFLEELSALYEIYVNDSEERLAELPIQYADYAVWHHRQLSEARMQAEVGYWRKKLSGELPVLALPFDRPRPPVQDYYGKHIRARLDKALYLQVSRFARAHNVTFFMTILAAYKILLYRYSGQSDILVGTPVDNRNRAELEHMIGLFMNTLVLRTDLSGNPSFNEFLQRVCSTTLEAFSNQDVPFEKIVEILRPERDMSYNPIFQALFILHTGDQVESHWGDNLRVSHPYMENGLSQVDISLYASKSKDGLDITLEYNTDLFDVQTAETLLKHFIKLVRDLTASPAQTIDDLTLLSVAEEDRLLIDWNQTGFGTPEASVHELFEAQVLRQKDKIALTVQNRQMSYNELNNRANQFAHFLRDQGVTIGDRVGVLLGRSDDMLIGILGIMKSGAAYVALDPAFPQERIGYMIDDAKLKAVITQSALSYRVTGKVKHIILTDAHWGQWNKKPVQNPGIRVSARDTAYVLYTSGSSGKPKGVDIHQEAVVNFLTSMASRQPGFSEKDLFLALTTISFDISVLEIFLPLSIGAGILMVDTATSQDGHELKQQLDTHPVTVMQATPATWEMLLECGWKGRPSMKILCGGETLSRDLANALIDCCGELWNMYGPTEATVWATCRRITRKTPRITIGTPLANTAAFIVDRSGKPQPPGVAGELLLGGKQISRGYLNLPELTAEKFIEPPAPLTDAVKKLGFVDKLYRTGDLARFTSDGNVEFLGRLDNQIKIRGFRIEPGEVESILLRSPAVEQAVVTMKEIGKGDKRMIAYVVTNYSHEFKVSDLRKLIRASLPDYMMPSLFMALEEFPLTANGKVDRAALPLPDGVRAADVSDFRPPATGAERDIAAIWQKLIGVSQVGILDNFYDLGGHSLLSIRMISHVQKELGFKLSPRDVLVQTLGQIAAKCENNAAPALNGGNISSGTFFDKLKGGLLRRE